MDLNRKIKKLRIDKGVTQEKLADYLNISIQAVSKWENGTSSPDISLLPSISSYFGVTIDELFTLNDDAHLERIENMLENEHVISLTDENYAKNQLLNLIENSSKKADAYRLLAQLSNRRAEMYHKEASEYAKKALTLEPNNKENHNAFTTANGGVSSDWNYDQHRDIINYYKEFVKMNPELKRGHMYYIDHLIADERLDEALEALKNIQSIEDNYIVSWYQGKIEKAKGNHETAIEHFDDMVKREPDNWLSYSTRADEFARLSFYDKAIEDNKKAYELQPHPKYIDSQECRAIIYEFLGEPKKAIEMWKEAQKVLKSDWNITFGRIYDGTDNEIRRLEQLI